MTILNCQDGLTADDIINAVNHNTSNNRFLSNFIAYDTPLFLKESSVILAPTQSSVSTISGGTVIGDSDFNAYKMLGAEPEWAVTSAGFQRFFTPQSGQTALIVRSFLYDGRFLEFRIRDLASNFTLSVDGELKSEFNAGSLNLPRYYNFDFGSAKLRRIELISRNEYWGGLVIEPGTSAIATDSTNLKIGVMGDSFTGGTGSSFSQTYCATIGAVLRNVNMYQFGVGGSGYVNDTGSGKFINRITEVTDLNPDIMIIAGGINDLLEDESVFQSNVDSFYASLLSSISVKKIVIAGVWYLQNPTPVAVSFNNILKAKADEIGAKFIDSIGDEWVTGTGKYDSRTGDGNADVYRGSDGTHPTKECHRFLGRKIATELMNF